MYYCTQTLQNMFKTLNNALKNVFHISLFVCIKMSRRSNLSLRLITTHILNTFYNFTKNIALQSSKKVTFYIYIYYIFKYKIIQTI